MQIKVYTTTTCPYCKMEKAFLAEKGIKYESIVVDEDPEAADELFKVSGHMGVPVTIITKDDNSKEIILGFDQKKIEQALSL